MIFSAKTIIAALLVTVVSLGSWAFASTEARIGILEVSANERASRLATLEALATSQQKQFDRLEDKLDWIIESTRIDGPNWQVTPLRRTPREMQLYPGVPQKP